MPSGLNFKQIIPKILIFMQDLVPAIYEVLKELYFKSIFYRLKHVKESKYSWLKSVQLEILDSQYGILTHGNLKFILEKKRFDTIPSHQKYLYSALIPFLNLPSFYLLFWDDLVVFHEIFIEDLYKLGEFPIKPGDIVLDVGASIGWYACKVAKMAGDNGKVIAIEPNPTNFALLNKNVNLNELNNTILINKGIWDTQVKKMLKLKGYASSIGDDLKMQSGELVQFDTIDKILKEHNIKKVNELKMDIEGAEIEAIKGSQEILKRSNNLVLKIAAYHKMNSGAFTYEKLIPLLKKWHYDVREEYLPIIFGKKTT